MKRFLLSFVFLYTLLLAFSGPEAYAQEREGGKDPKDPVLKGQRGILLDLEDEYCSEGADDLIQIPDTEIPGDAVSVRWEVTTNYGDGLDHPDYIENASGATISGSSIYFKPNTVDSIYWDNTRVYLQYYFVNDEGFDTGTTKYDYTFVKRSPWVFDLTSDKLEICEGDNATLTLSGSETDYEYLFFRNGVEIETQAKPGSGAPLNFTASVEGEYTVQAVRTDGIVCGEVMNGAPYITVHPNPTPDPISNGPVCQGENIVLQDNDPVVPGYVYTWFGPGLPVGGQNGHTVTVSDNATINTASTHTYTLTISDGNFSTNCEVSATVDVTVNERPEVAPTVDPVCEGGTATLNANPSKGSGDYTFSWTSNPAGFTSALENPQITNATIGVDDIEYIVEVTDNISGCSAFNTGSTTLVVNDVPEVNITGPTEVCEGSTASYTANVTGSGTYDYQWQLDGTDLPGETGSTVSFDAASLPSIGSHSISVDVVDVSNATNCSANATISLEVYDTPEVTITEGNQEVCEATAVTFTSSVTGSGTYTYQWFIDGTALPGETGSALNIDAASLPTAGTYSVSVDVVDTFSPLNCSGAASATLTINDVPVVSVSGPAEVCDGSTADFTATVTGSGTYNYQWQVDGTDLPGETNSTLSFTAATLPSAGNHTISVGVVDVSNPTNCSTIESVVFTVNENPTVSLPDAATCDGDDVILTATASGGSANYVNYTWYNGIGTQIGSDPSNTLTLTGTDVDLANNGATYSVTVEDDNGCISVSDAMTLTVNENPSVTIEYQGNSETNIDVCLGSSMTLEAQGSGGSGVYTYSWTLPDNSTSTVNPLIIDPVALADDGVYEVTIDDGNCTVTQQITVNVIEVTASIAVTAPVAGATTICENTSVTFEATGGDSYEFYHVDVSAGTTTMVHNASNEWTTSTLEDGDEVYVTASNILGCSDDSDPIVMTVNPTPTVSVSSDGTNDEYCDGSQVTLTAIGDGGAVSGSDPSGYEYVWYHEGTVVPGVSTATHQFTGDNGVNDGLYEVVAIDDNGAGCSSAVTSVTVTVHQLPDATLDVDPPFFIEGTEVTFTAVAGYTSYEFEVNGTNVQGPGANNTYVTSTLVDQDEVTVIVREDHGTVQCENSSTVVMTVFDSVNKPLVTVTNEEYCEGSTGGTVTVDNPQQDVTYELVYDDGTPVTGYSQIVYNGTNTVSWNNVLDDNGGTSTPTTFRVKAFWAALTPDGDQLSDPFDITEHPNPTEYTMSVDGASAAGGITETDCNAGAGYPIGLYDGHEAVDYTLLLNGSQILEQKSGAGVLSSFTFDNNYAFIGTYTIVAENTNGCTTDIIGSFTIQGDAVSIFDLNAEDGGLYCESDADGVELTLSGSESGVDYELLRDGVSVGTFPGDGDSISLGNYTTEGQYAVQVTTSGGCIYPMNGVVDVYMILTPDTGNLTATNGGHYCDGSTGVDITLEITQEEGVTYQLFDVSDNTLIGSSVDGTAGGGDITFITDFTTEGTYQVRALAGTIACPALSNEITVVADALPNTALPVSVISEKCGPTGSANIGITNSETDVEYQWENTTTGTVGSTWESGNGGILSFEVLDAGTYIFHAQRIGTATGCSADLSNSVEVIERPLPDETVTVSTEGGTGCDDGIIFTIDNPEANIEYGLYKLDNTGNPVYVQSSLESDGSSSPISFGAIVDNNAQYYIDAVSDYGCRVVLNGAPWAVNISGAVEKFALKPESGDICNGEDGIAFYLDNSVSGVDYVLSLEGAGDTRNDTVTSTGGMVEFAPVLEEGTYYVTGLSGVDASCNSEMLNRVELVVHPLPKAYNMIGAGDYCDGTGAVLGLENSEPGVTYILQRHTDLGKRNISPAIVGTAPDEPVFFAAVLEENDDNVFSVMAISDKGCTSSMKDSIEVSFNPDVPADPDVAESISLCGEPFSEVILNSVESGATYHLYDPAGELVDESEVDGTTLATPLYVTEFGDYTLRSSWDGGCMSDPLTITVTEGAIPVVTEPEYKSLICPGESASIGYDISADDETLGWSYSIVDADFNEYLSETDATLTDGSDSLIWTINDAGSYYVAVSGCETDYSSRIDIQIADNIEMPSFTQSVFNYCHNDDRVIIDIQNVDTNGNYVYRLIDSADSDRKLYGAVFSDDDADNLYFEPTVGGDTPSSYGLLARDLDTGCEIVMEEENFVDVEMYPVPDETITVEQDTIIFDPEAVDAYEVSLSSYEDRVVYEMYYESEDDLFSSISDQPFSIAPASIEEGDYIIYARHLDAPDCASVEIGSVLFKEKGITAFEFSLLNGRTNYCEDEVVEIQLSNSQVMVEYELLRNGYFVERKRSSGGSITFRDNNYMDTETFDSGGRIDLNYEIIGYFGDDVPVPMVANEDAIFATVWKKPEDKVIKMKTRSGDISLGGQCSASQEITISVISPEINNRYFVEYSYPDSLHLDDNYFEKRDSIDVTGISEDIEFHVDTAGYYRIKVANQGCRPQVLKDTVQISQFREPIAEDFLMRIPENEILGVVDVMENAVTDPRLDNTDYRYDWVYPVPYDTVSFSYIDADVEFNYDEYSGTKFEGSPFIQYTRPAGFIGKDSVRYTVNIGVCPDSKIDTGLITVIVGNEILPNEDEILIPNAFSPNGDGMNDYFVLSGVPNEGQTTLMVFNRWGNLVYESGGRRYQNDWDGSANISNMVSIGQDLPNGVYFYIFSVKMTVGTTLKTKEYNGYIELRR